MDSSPDEKIPEIEKPRFSTVNFMSRAIIISSSTISTLAFFVSNFLSL